MYKTICSTAGAFLLLAQFSSAADWVPITPADLAVSAPRIDPDADAETMLWEVWITDHIQGSQLQKIIKQYVRVKVFTERGVEDQSTIDLVTTGKDTRVQDLAGRTIKPDGAIIELEKAAIFQRTVAKASGVKVRTKSFSMPNVEPGDIIEYQWREFEDDATTNYLRLYGQRTTPSWKVIYHVKPQPRFAELGYTMSSQTFNAQHAGFQPEPQGFYRTELSNLSAFREEPRMPPEDHVRGWILLFYSKRSESDQEKFWKEVGKESYDRYKKLMKVDGTVKQTAAQITANAQTVEEKVSAVRNYCLNEIKSVYHDRSGFTAEQRADFKGNRTPGQTIKNGMGTSYDINLLFATLLNALGIEARPARVPGRDDVFFNPGFLDPYLLNRINIAVRIQEEWRFYDLSAPYIPEGMLRWPEEGVQALITDAKAPEWVETPLSPPEKTSAKRRANFTLTPDGAIEGTVRYEYTGHFAHSRKTIYDAQSDEELAEMMTEAIVNRLSTAEVSDFKYFNVKDVDQSLAYQYKIRVPGYAQVTGKRIFLQPNYFKMNSSPEFKTSERIHDIYFSYPWHEDDQVVFTLPEGFDFEGASSPGRTTFDTAGEYEAMLSKTPDGKLIYDRKMKFGDNGRLLFPASAYPQIKNVFDLMHQQDGHVITLRQADETASN